MKKKESIGQLQDLVSRAIDNAYDRGRQDLYLELVGELIGAGRTAAARWILDKSISHMYSMPYADPESLAMIEELRERLKALGPQ